MEKRTQESSSISGQQDKSVLLKIYHRQRANKLIILRPELDFSSKQMPFKDASALIDTLKFCKDKFLIGIEIPSTPHPSVEIVRRFLRLEHGIDILNSHETKRLKKVLEKTSKAITKALVVITKDSGVSELQQFLQADFDSFKKDYSNGHSNFAAFMKSYSADEKDKLTLLLTDTAVTIPDKYYRPVEVIVFADQTPIKFPELVMLAQLHQRRKIQDGSSELVIKRELVVWLFYRLIMKKVKYLLESFVHICKLSME